MEMFFMHPTAFIPAKPRPLTDIEFCAWIGQAMPGDRLEYHMTRVNQRRTMHWFSGRAIVDGQVVCEAEISAMLASLSAKATRAFILAVACGMSDDEVGAELGISGRMVRKYVAQAMLGCLNTRARQTAGALRQEYPL